MRQTWESRLGPDCSSPVSFRDCLNSLGQMASPSPALAPALHMPSSEAIPSGKDQRWGPKDTGAMSTPGCSGRGSHAPPHQPLSFHLQSTSCGPQTVTVRGRVTESFPSFVGSRCCFMDAGSRAPGGGSTAAGYGEWAYESNHPDHMHTLAPRMVPNLTTWPRVQHLPPDLMAVAGHHPWSHRVSFHMGSFPCFLPI